MAGYDGYFLVQHGCYGQSVILPLMGAPVTDKYIIYRKKVMMSFLNQA